MAEYSKSIAKAEQISQSSYAVLERRGGGETGGREGVEGR